MQTQALQTAHSSCSFGVDVFTLQSSEIERAWPWIEKFLDRVPAHDWEPEDVKRDLMAAKAQLWGAIGAPGDPYIKGIWVTRIERSHSKTYGTLWIASGSPLDDGLRLYREHTEPWLKEKGCEFVQIFGRAGWGKVLKDFREVGRVYVKDLNHEQ